MRFPSSKFARSNSIVLNEGVNALEFARAESQGLPRDARELGAATQTFEQQLEEQLAAEEARLRAAGETSSANVAAEVSTSSTRGLSSLRLIKAKQSSRRGSRQKALPPQGSVSPFLMVKALLGFRRKMARVGVDVPQGCEPAPGDRSSTSEATDLAARPPRNLDEALARMAEASRDDDWLGRNAAIQALPGLLEPLAAQPDALKKAMDALGEPMSRQLADLRSAIVRSACDALRQLAIRHARALAPLVTAGALFPRITP